jgi:hypothetical protein
MRLQGSGGMQGARRRLQEASIWSVTCQRAMMQQESRGMHGAARRLQEAGM